MQKSYNPFKMWGSWVGAGVGVVLAILPILSLSGLFIIEGWSYFKYFNPFFLFFPSCHEIGCAFIGIIAVFLMPIVVSLYFLAGWLIHSIVRKFLKV